MRIIDIAVAAGVSPATVSRVINGGKSIAPATAAMVRRVMYEMGYDPAGTGRAKTSVLSGIEADPIGFQGEVLVLSFASQCWMDVIDTSDLLKLLSRELSHFGFRTSYLHCEQSGEVPPNFFASAQGMILLEGQPSPRLARQIQNKPAVSLFASSTAPGDHILTGNFQSGRLAGRYLLNKGYRQMVLLLPEEASVFVAEQADGFRTFCKNEQGVMYREVSFYAPSESEDNPLEALETQMERAMESLMAVPADPLGVFAPSCLLTSLAYRWLYSRGIEIGKTIQFVCSGTSFQIVSGLFPRPVMIDINLMEMVQYAARLLVMRIKKPDSCKPLQISVVPRVLTFE